jgi:BASS family bile acid:Na+ symporter
MGSALTTVLLPLALTLVMFGLGLSLTVGDFARVGRQPRAVVIALVLQLLVLPAVCFGLVLAFDLAPLPAVGLMLLAASPGGPSANLFNHLFRGDVALSITLTAVNSLIAVITLPVITNAAIHYFEPEDGGSLGLQPGRTLQVFAVVLVPVVIGMVVRQRATAVADRWDKPVRIASAVALVLVVMATIVAERENLAGYISEVGLPALLFGLVSLTVGFLVPRLFGVVRRQAIASAFEIGVHNGTLAIAVAISALGSVGLAVPAAVYSLIMFPVAGLFGWAVTRSSTRTEAAAPVTTGD